MRDTLILSYRDEPLREFVLGERALEVGRDAVAIGRATADNPGSVVMTTLFGGGRIIDMLVGEQLPRIC